MESIFKELIFLDQKAKKIVSGAERELNNMDSIIESKAAEVTSEIEAMLSTKIHRLRADSAAYIALKKAEIDEDTDARLAKMEAEWEANAKKWQDEIFNSCIQL